MINIEDVKKFKKVDSELLEVVKQRIEQLCDNYAERNELEDTFGFEYNGVNYDVFCIDESDWSDEGKYQYQDIIYQLVSYDKNAKGYLTNDSVIDRFNLFFNLSVARSGSYFSYYYYEYQLPYIMFADIKYVPEQIIPAHEEVCWKREE